MDIQQKLWDSADGDTVESLRQRNSDLVTGLEACDEQVVALRQQLSDHIKREVMLWDGLKRADDLLTHSYDHVSPLIREALAATADLDGLILCEKEPVAWQTFDGEGGYDYRSYEDNEDYRDDYIKRNSNQKFYENWVIPLYRAWGPK